MDTTSIAGPSPLDNLPEPATIQDRLRVVLHEEKLLRRLLALALAAREKRHRCVADRESGSLELVGAK